MKEQKLLYISLTFVIFFLVTVILNYAH